MKISMGKMIDTSRWEIPHQEVSVTIGPAEIASLPPVDMPEQIVGQARAVEALELGTAVNAAGYNVFVSGAQGTGRYTAVKRTVTTRKPQNKDLFDIAYVYNFKQPQQPRVLYFGPSRAGQFKKAIHQMVENLKSIIRVKLESSRYQEQRDRTIAVIEQQENAALTEFESKLGEDNFEIIQVQDGEARAVDIVPLWKGERTSFPELQDLVIRGKLSEDRWDLLREKYYRYMDEMRSLFKELRTARNLMEEEIETLKVETVRPDVLAEVDRIREQFTGDKVASYLDDLEEDLLANLYLFTEEGEFTDERGNPRFIRYGVNILVDSSEQEYVPVVYENHPTITNLVGSIESHIELGGEVRTNFMMIRAGSLITSSGGFLVLEAEDLFRDDQAWYQLKKILQTGTVEIRHIQGPLQFSGQVLKPEPITVDVKVIIIGEENLYETLSSQDPGFEKLFPVSAEFDTVMPRNSETTAQYAGFIRHFLREHHLLEIDDHGIAAILEYAVRIAENKNKYTTCFSLIGSVLIEADYWARRRQSPVIDGEAVEETLEKRKYFTERTEKNFDEMVVGGEVALETEGSVVGRVNGLAVYDQGRYSFGRPVRVSAQVSPGDEGVVNIEREAGLSGETHDKGMLILEGYLRGRYASDFPLSIRGSICFEQSYMMIDGDSASLAEIAALLSSVAELPVRQDIAVTGSINQMGEVQSVKGINEKAEGFYRVCKKRGITGSQGVIIPKSNRINLVLSRELVAAVEKGEFRLFAVDTVDQVLSILTGMEWGARNSQGVFPEQSVNICIEQRLRRMADHMRTYSS
jgi:predicted ATP-dependent protease